MALVWKGSVFREQTFSRTSEPVISVGETESATFRTPAPEFDGEFEMFERTDRGYVVRFTDNIRGEITLGGDEWSLHELTDQGRVEAVGRMSTSSGGVTIYELELVRGDWGLVELNGGEVFFQVMHQPAVVAGRGFGGVDIPVMGMALLAGIAHLLFLLLASLSYTIEPTMQPIAQKIPWATTEIQGVDSPDDEPKEESPEPGAQSNETSEPSSAVGGPAGKVGTEASDKKETKGASTKTEAAANDDMAVDKIGVLDQLSGQNKRGAIGKIFGGQESFDEKLKASIRGDADDLETGRGSSGFNVRGTNQGGGAYGEVGDIGGVQGGDGTPGGGSGASVPDKEKRRDTPPVTSGDGVETAKKFCDKADIQQTVSSRMNAIRYCYEQQLNANPTLEGKVELQWKIGLDGSVTSTSVMGSTLENRAVERCIARVVRERMQFAKPEGGICVVRYPFVFRGPVE